MEKKAQKKSFTVQLQNFFVPRTRLELAHPCEHQPLKLACLPISPSGLFSGAKIINFPNEKPVAPQNNPLFKAWVEISNLG